MMAVWIAGGGRGRVSSPRPGQPDGVACPRHTYGASFEIWRLPLGYVDTLAGGSQPTRSNLSNAEIECVNE